jgi:hypothetical protein
MRCTLSLDAQTLLEHGAAATAKAAAPTEDITESCCAVFITQFPSLLFNHFLNFVDYVASQLQFIAVTMFTRGASNSRGIWDSSVSIVTGYGLEDSGVRF